MNRGLIGRHLCMVVSDDPSRSERRENVWRKELVINGKSF